ncbi:MAG: nucleotidyltransferase domain-containing protein [Nitrososphaerota archaeon]
MGKAEARGDWIKVLRAFEKRLSKLISIEALIVHGSACRSGLGPTSDIDVLVISDDFKNLALHKRLSILEEARVERIQALGYTFSELEKMVLRANPLALGALVEGIMITSSERIQQLKERAKKMYIRQGRVWKPSSSQ